MNKVRVEGMHCNHCRLAVLEALNKLPGAKGVAVDLEHGMVTWQVIESRWKSSPRRSKTWALM